jgi:hypothetical protein
MKQSSSSRRVAPDGEAEIVTPLTGPSYGAYSVARRRWRKPLEAVLAEAAAISAEVSARLARGVYAPDREGEAHYREIYEDLCRASRQQLAALKAFSGVEWRER